MEDTESVDIGCRGGRIRKKMLHILNSEPDDTQRKLINDLSKGYHTFEFPLYEEHTDEDYDELVHLIFEYNEVITWW
jgi:hypothetical protein